VSDSVRVPCPHNSADCGEIHSIKWYRGEVERVFVYSPFSDFRNSENFLKDRADVEETGDNSDLVIAELKSTDDGDYRCEITYLDVSSACKSVFQHTLTTSALPKSVRLDVGGEQLLEADRTSLGQVSGVAGPYEVDTQLDFTCNVDEVKPSADISWTVGGQHVEASDVSIEDLEGGSVNVESRLILDLNREHLASAVRCSVSFQDSEVAQLSVELDITVAPRSVELDAPLELFAGQEAVLECRTDGARPPASLSWQGVQDLQQAVVDTQENLEDDVTFSVVSQLKILPRPRDDKTNIRCVVEHPSLEEPLDQSQTIDVKYAPEVTIPWENVTVLEGDQLELTCQFAANPRESSITQWFFNSEEITSNNEWSITVNENGDSQLATESITRTSQGQYTCAVANTIGDGTSNTVDIDVLYAPEVKIPWENVTLLEGDQLELTCLFTANPRENSITRWFFNSEELTSPDEWSITVNEDGNSQLVTDSLIRTSHGQYTCAVANMVGEETSNTVELDILYAPEVTIPWENVTVLEGDQLELTCQFTANPRENSITQWFFNSEEITSNDEWNITVNENGDSQLVTDSLGRSSHGQYACAVANTIGTGLSNSLDIDILFGPEEVDLVVDELVAGQPGQASCTAVRSKPPAYPRWEGSLDDAEQMEEIQETLEDDSSVTVTSVLTFNPLSHHHNSILSCIVEMEEPIQFNTQQDVILDVQFAPEVSIEWENTTLEEGDRVEIRCPYNANPLNESTVTWFFNTEEIVPSEDAYFSINEDEEHMLVLEQVNRVQSGEYSCRVENSRGASNAPVPVSLDVMYAPEVEVSLQLSDESLVEGTFHNATVRCNLVDGNPFVMETVLWFLDGSLIMEQECYDSECELELEGERSETGNWSCQASNTVGVGAPSLPQHLQVHYTASEGTVDTDQFDPVKGENCTLTCELDDLGFPPVDSYAWTRNDELIDGEVDMYLFLEELQANSEANYSCSGVNAAGTNFGPGFFLDVSAHPAFIQVPDPVAIMEEDFQWVNLTCQVECSPPCSIQWFRNMERVQAGGESYKTLEKAEDDTSLFRDYEVMISTAVDPEEEDAESELELTVGEQMIDELGEAGEDIFFLVFSEEQPMLPELNQFESILSTLAIQLGNRTMHLVNTFQHSNFTCMARQRDDPNLITAEVETVESEAADPVYDTDEVVDDNLVEAEDDVEVEISSTTMLIIQHMPMDIQIVPPSEVALEDGEVVLVEGETAPPFTCSASAVPEALVVWMKDDNEVSADAMLKLSEPIHRSDGGEYTCQASNQHGVTTQTVNVQVQFLPECSVSYEETDELYELKCAAEGHPQDFVFWWRHESKSFEGQMENGFSMLSLNKQNVNASALSEYVCMVNNTVGMSEACRLPGIGILAENPLLLFLIVGGAVVGLLLLVLLLWYVCCRENSGEPKQKGKSDSKEPHPDNAFYDNLPFHGLKNPPKQILNAVDDNMVYADVDAQETYSYGPLQYKSASLQRAKKKKLEESNV